MRWLITDRKLTDLRMKLLLIFKNQKGGETAELYTLACKPKTLTCFNKSQFSQSESYLTPFIAEQGMPVRLDPLLICLLGCCVINQQPSFLSWAQKRRKCLLGEHRYWCFPWSGSM
jgi:hypothetical protein